MSEVAKAINTFTTEINTIAVALEDRCDDLRDEVKALQSQLDAANAEIEELQKDSATAFWIHPDWGQTTLPPSTWSEIEKAADSTAPIQKSD